MKSRIYIFLLLLGQAILLAGCSRDNLGVAGGDNGQEQAGKAYVSLNLMSDKQTITRDDPAQTEPGRDKERIVNDVIILLYKNTGTSADDNLAYGWILNVTNDSQGNGTLADFENLTDYGLADDMILTTEAAGYTGPTETSFRTVAVEVESQPYYLVIFANGYNGCHIISDLLNDDEDEATWDPETGVITPNPEALIYNLHDMMAIDQRPNRSDTPPTWDPISPSYFYTGGTEQDAQDFFMSNANGPVPVPVSALRQTPQAAQDEPIPVSLDRAVAKVLVNAKNSPGGTPVYSGGRVEDFQWCLKNINTKEYLLRHYARMLDSPGTEEIYGNSILASRMYLYGTDSNYTLADQDPDDFESVQGYKSLNDWDDDLSGIKETGWQYATENTIDLASQQGDNWKDYTTYVHARVRIVYDALPSIEEENNSYYSFYQTSGTSGWKVFTHTQALGWILSDQFPADMSDLRVLIGYCTAPGSAGSYVNGTSGFEFYDNGTALNQPTFNDCLDADEMDIIVLADNAYNPSIEEGASVWFHFNGINEYDIPIKHYLPSAGTREGTYGHYGLVRNNVYRLTITSITGPGVPHVQAAWIATNITINEWFNREQSENI